jgi:hypothetical protein
LANKALDPIQKKLKGLDGEKQMTVNNQVERLIRDATSLPKLVGPGILPTLIGHAEFPLAGKDVCWMDGLAGELLPDETQP